MNKNLFAVLKIALGSEVTGISMKKVKAKEKQMKKDFKEGNINKYTFEESLQFIGYNPKYIKYVDEPAEIMQAIAISQCPDVYKYILEPTADITEMYFKLKREKKESHIDNFIIAANALIHIAEIAANTTMIVTGIKNYKQVPQQKKQFKLPTFKKCK